jgi:nucleoside-diphosphate-sugar epimerase
MSKAILITGVTGKQGRAVLQKLSASTGFTLYGVTRNEDSPTCSNLLRSTPGLKLITGDLDNPTAIFESIPRRIWGVFSVQAAFVSGFNPLREERQGKALVDAAVANGVTRFVYSSVDRHGPQSSDDPTNVPHFKSKFRIEKYLAQQCEELVTATNPMTYTILRLPIFMENFTNDFMGRLFATTWKVALREDKTLQLISTADIGHWVHKAFTDDLVGRNKAVSLAGDELTFTEANTVFKERFGYDLPRTYDVLGWGMISYGEVRWMMEWFDRVGCAADIEELRKENPQLVSFKDWLGKSNFIKQ